MGLFGFFNKPALPDIKSSLPDIGIFTEALVEYNNAMASGSGFSYEEKASSCAKLLSAISQTKEADIVRVFHAEGKKEKGYYSHIVLGTLWNGSNYLKDLSAEVERKMNRNNVLSRKSKEFAAGLHAIPLVPALVVDAAPPLRRGALSDMPEVKYSTITKSFNADKLPSFVVIDTETNGLKVQGGRILELSAIRYEDFQPVAAWSSLVNPGKPIPPEVSEINHINDAMVAGAPRLEQISGSFLDFIGSSAVVGYNLPFDLKFLFARGIDLFSQKRKYYDVLELARKAYKKDLDSFSLEDVAELCGVFRDDAHRSLSDCFATGTVFKNCVEDITDK